MSDKTLGNFGRRFISVQNGDNAFEDIAELIVHQKPQSVVGRFYSCDFAYGKMPYRFVENREYVLNLVFVADKGVYSDVQQCVNYLNRLELLLNAFVNEGIDGVTKSRAVESDFKA